MKSSVRNENKQFKFRQRRIYNNKTKMLELVIGIAMEVIKNFPVLIQKAI